METTKKTLILAGNTGGRQYAEALEMKDSIILAKEPKEPSDRFYETFQKYISTTKENISSCMLIGFNDVKLQMKVFSDCRSRYGKVGIGMDVYYEGTIPPRYAILLKEADYVLTPSRIANEYLESINQKKYFMIGNPTFKYLSHSKKKELDTTKPLKVLFAEQCEDFNGPVNALKTYFSEREISCEIVTRLHPETKFSYEGNIDSTKVAESEWESYLKQYDAIFGRNSTLQLKSAYLGIPTIWHNPETEPIEDSMDSITEIKGHEIAGYDQSYVKEILKGIK